MSFHPDLQKRAADFLNRVIPAELTPHYLPGSLADIIVTHCAQAQPLDPELCEIAEISVIEYEQAIARAQTTELKAYYAECQQLLREIVCVTRKAMQTNNVEALGPSSLTTGSRGISRISVSAWGRRVWDSFVSSIFRRQS